MQGLLSYRTEMRQELHAEATCKERFIRSLAHFEEEFDAMILAFPWQDVRIAFYHYDVNQVKSL